MKDRDVNIETEIISMGDVGVAINMVDLMLADGSTEQAERAVVILKEIFASRYERLRCCMAG